MDLGIEERTALVLGSTSGLGSAIAERLAAEGARVMVCGRRADLAAQVAAGLPGAASCGVDLTDAASIEQLVRRTRESLGEIDILVLNSGGPPPGKATELTAGQMAESLQPLLLAQIQLVGLTLGSMQARGWGRILAVGSSGVQQPLPNLVRSNVARAALAAYLKTLAAEAAELGTTVNMILPGRINTDRIGALDAAQAARTATAVDAVRSASQASIPARRYGRPAEFADMAAFLCSERAAYITGSQIRVDGGLIASL